MARILILALVVVAVFWWLRAKRKPGNDRTKAAPPPPTTPQLRPQTMVACHHCGTHLPETDALHNEGHWYCSPAHRDAKKT